VYLSLLEEVPKNQLMGMFVCYNFVTVCTRRPVHQHKVCSEVKWRWTKWNEVNRFAFTVLHCVTL